MPHLDLWSWSWNPRHTKNKSLKAKNLKNIKEEGFAKIFIHQLVTSKEKRKGKQWINSQRSRSKENPTERRITYSSMGRQVVKRTYWYWKKILLMKQLACLYTNVDRFLGKSEEFKRKIVDYCIFYNCSSWNLVNWVHKWCWVKD